MKDDAPLVSIGLPVYNSEQYLQQSIDSLLNQSYQNIELLISDNDSQDATEAICNSYLQKDSRVKYKRNEKNIGGFRNHNQVVKMASGKYFMWAASDDIRHKYYVEKCVDVLERSPDVVVCYSHTVNIDSSGQELQKNTLILNLNYRSPSERFRELIKMGHLVEPIYGMFRMDTLSRTNLLGQFPDADRVFMSEIGLRGRLHKIEEPLFFRREHDQKSTSMYPSRRAINAWINPENKKAVFPYNRELKEYIAVVNRSPIGVAEKIRCYLRILGWIKLHWRKLIEDVEYVGRDILRPYKHRLMALMKHH